MQFYWNASDDTIDITTHNRFNDMNASLAQKVRNALPFKNIDYSYKMLAGTLWVIYMEEEIAIPRHNFVQAAQAVRELVKKELQKSSMFTGVLFRFVSRDPHNYLSTAGDHDVVFFSITTPSRSGYESFYKEFYNAMLPYGGRPHWGKINYLTKEDTQQLYGENYDKFVAVRKKLDPHGMFSNAFTKRVFGW